MKRFDWVIYFDDPNDLALEYDGLTKKVAQGPLPKAFSPLVIEFQKENRLW